MNNIILRPSFDDLFALATNRREHLFLKDVERSRDQISDCIHQARVLVIGGAGSIGGATLKELLRFSPKSVHVVDYSENSLVELVRDLRSEGALDGIEEFATFPVNFGSEIMPKFLKHEKPYSLVLNFAALKHVRSEKNVFSLLQMLDTNILKQLRLMKWLSQGHQECSLFCVSTDKAANPVNLMGASKRVMENIIFSRSISPGYRGNVFSTRFANVAFSEGSLLSGYLLRFQKRQPLACPSGVKRYFISLKEAGLLCLLASCCSKDRHIMIPKLNASHDLQDLQTVTERIIKHFGFEPIAYFDEKEARSNIMRDISLGRYPLLLTKLDTSGEKAFEEFVGEGELAFEAKFRDVMLVKSLNVNNQLLLDFLARLDSAVNDVESCVSKSEIGSWFESIVPHFKHIETGKDLDSRM